MGPSDPRGYLYIVAPVEAPEVFKLGRSKQHPIGRLADLQTAHWYQLRLVHWWHGDQEEEQRLHAVLDDARIRGEWFDTRASARQRWHLPPDIAEVLRQLAVSLPGRAAA